MNICLENEVAADADNDNEGSKNQEADLKRLEIADYAISEKFLQSVFKYDNEAKADERVWRVEGSDLPALVQVVRVSKEKHGSHAFSICDGNGYLWNSCFLSRDIEIPLNSVVQIISLENVKCEDYDKDDFLERGSVFDDVLAIAEVEMVCPGANIGHCLWDLQSCKQLYVLSSGALDDTEIHLNILNNKDLWETSMNPKKSDVKFEFTDGQVIHAHKHVLREKSSVFEAHFAGDRVFADQELVKIKDSNCRTFTKFLRWIYGFNIQFECLETMFDLVYLSDKYIVAQFLPILRAKVKENLEHSPKRAVAASNLNKTGDVAIADIIFGVVDKHIQLLCHTEEMLKWDFDTIAMVFARNSLNIDEYQLLQYLFKWVQYCVPTKQQFLTLLDHIKFEEIHKSVMLNFLESDAVKDVIEKKLVEGSELEILISLRKFRNSGALEKRVLFSKGFTCYSTYRSLEHFKPETDDPSILSPVIFPLSLTPDTLTSLPMVILNDDFTLIQPNVLLKSNDGNYSLECVIRLNGAVSGLPDLSVFRQADYFRHVSDIQARVELHYRTTMGWDKQVQDLTQGGIIKFKGDEFEMAREVFGNNHVFRGCLVVRQFKIQDDSFNMKNISTFEAIDGSSESEPEGEDLGHDDDEEEEDVESDEDELDDFIQDDAEEADHSGEEEETQEEIDLNEHNDKDSESDDAVEAQQNSDAQFSSDDEIVKQPNYQNKRQKTRGKLSSDEEEPCKKKRRRVIVDSDSEEDEEKQDQNLIVETNLNSGSEESEYETDNEMGEHLESNNAGTPEVCFSDDANNDNALNDSNEAKFSSDEENPDKSKDVTVDEVSNNTKSKTEDDPTRSSCNGDLDI